MMSIVYLFWMFVILFAIVGWMRGWAKELLVAFSVIPVGSVPVTDQVMVPMPLVCVNVCEYGEPAVPLAMVAGFTVIVWQPMTSV